MHRLNVHSKVLVFGHRGLVGSSLVRLLQQRGFASIITVPKAELDLRNQEATHRFIEARRPEYVIVAAATVGGIVANSSYPYDFIYDNILMSANVIEACRKNAVHKVMMLGSTCIYPRMAPQPIQEDSLLTGPLELTNEWYAVAKIAGIKMGQAARRQYGLNVISAMPTNLYGPNDNYDLHTSHVLPALIRKFHDAKVEGHSSVSIWGTGTPRREFLHVDDLSKALLLLLEQYDNEEIINIGCGKDISIADLASLVGQIVGFQGEIVFDPTKPDGTPKKQTDITRILQQGWTPQIRLSDGIAEAYDWYLKKSSPVPTP